MFNRGIIRVFLIEGFWLLFFWYKPREKILMKTSQGNLVRTIVSAKASKCDTLNPGFNPIKCLF